MTTDGHGLDAGPFAGSRRAGVSVAVFWLILVGAGGLSGVGPATADQSLDCDAYAAKAVAQHRENQALGCGFAGGAWSADHAGHRGWCVLPDVRMADLTREDAARAGALVQCGQKRAACEGYATLATEQHRENVRGRCGLSGGPWSDDVHGHRTWCMGATAEQSVAETTARQVALQGCDASLAGIALQEATQKQQQLMNMMGNVVKALRDSQMGVIQQMQ